MAQLRFRGWLQWLRDARLGGFRVSSIRVEDVVQTLSPKP